MYKKYIVKLKSNERKKLIELSRKGTEKARKLKRCCILLLSDEGRTDAEIAKILKVSSGTAGNIRERYVDEGLESALNEKPRPGNGGKFKGRVALCYRLPIASWVFLLPRNS